MDHFFVNWLQDLQCFIQPYLADLSRIHRDWTIIGLFIGCILLAHIWYHYSSHRFHPVSGIFPVQIGVKVMGKMGEGTLDLVDLVDLVADIV